MSVVYDVEGIVIGERAKLEKIAKQYLNDPEAKEQNCTLEAKINDEGNLEFKGQGVGRNWETPAVEKYIEKYLDDDVECYKLWGSTDGCWDQYTNDTEGKYYKQWYVNDYTHGTPKVFFDSFDDAKDYAMQIIRNNPDYIVGLENSGMDETDYFDEMFLQYLEVNQEPVQIVYKMADVVDDLVPVGNAEELFNQGNDYAFGNGVAQDYEKAAEYYKKAAAQKHSAAQFNLGILYAQGLGVQQDNKIAFECFLRSANLGNDDAIKNVGVCYEQGIGVQQDYQQAVEWYEKAAEQGNAEAQCNLADCYENGYGVEKDFVQAAKWYKKSAERGHETAVNWLNAHPEANIYGYNGEIEIDISKQNDDNNYYFANMKIESGNVEILTRRYIHQKSIAALRGLNGEGIRCKEELFKNCFENKNYMDIAKEFQQYSIKTFIPELKVFLDGNNVPYEDINMDQYDGVMRSTNFFDPKYFVALTIEEYKPKCLILVSACIDYNLLKVIKREYGYSKGRFYYIIGKDSMIECKPFKLKDILKAKDLAEMMQKLGNLFKGTTAYDDIISFFKENRVKYKEIKPDALDFEYSNALYLPKYWLDTHPEFNSSE